VIHHRPAVDDEPFERRTTAERERPHRIHSTGGAEIVHTPQGDVGQLADFERAQLGLPPEASRTADRAHPQGFPSGERPRTAT
jgi:hypothetical protein